MGGFFHIVWCFVLASPPTPLLKEREPATSRPQIRVIKSRWSGDQTAEIRVILYSNSCNSCLKNLCNKSRWSGDQTAEIRVILYFQFV